MSSIKCCRKSNPSFKNRLVFGHYKPSNLLTFFRDSIYSQDLNYENFSTTVYPGGNCYNDLPLCIRTGFFQ